MTSEPFERNCPYPAAFLAEYEPLECLAHGEGGETLVARGRADDELYIAKVSSDGADDEGKILEKLSHPALPLFICRFSGDGINIIVREYIYGLPLDAVINERAMSDAEAVSIGVSLCEALTYLHAQIPPVIHRDIKPQNVILCDDGTVKLIDFGISRRYRADAKKDTVFSGTSDFAPPEQYGFSQTDARADIYSFGMLMKYLLTGGDLEAPIENRRLRRVVRRCAAFTPRARYASAARVRRVLLSSANGPRRRNTAILALAMLLLGVAIGRFAVPFSKSVVFETQTEAREYGRAEGYGFIPEALYEASLDKTIVTWSQYCAMLGSMIELYDETLLPQWAEMTASAPDTPMQRDGGMLSPLFAAELMGIDRFNSAAPSEFGAYAPKVWDNVTMDYPVFDWNQYKMIDSGCYDYNYVGPAYDYCVRRVSNTTGLSLLEFDGAGDLRLEQPFTLREAAQSVLRLYESIG